MREFTLYFKGRKSGAIGAVYSCISTVNADSLENAVRELYKDYEHISSVREIEKLAQM